MAWLSGYSKRIAITLTGAASGAQTDYQIKLDVVYDFDMQVDFDDLRFTQADGETLLDAWLESSIDSTSADIWVKTDTPADGVDVDIYMYYGNSLAEPNWNGDDTFIQYHGAATESFLDPAVISPSSYIYEVRARRISAYVSDSAVWGIGDEVFTDGDTAWIQSYTSGNMRYLQCGNDGNRRSVTETPSFVTDVWYKGKIIWSGSGSVHGYWDDNEIGSGISTNIPNENMGLKMYEASGSFEQDWSFVHKYAENPPTYIFGDEEDQPTGVIIPVFIYHYLQMMEA